MQYINRFSDSGLQQAILTGNPGQRIFVTLRYLPTQQIWSMDVTYNDFTLNGIQIVFGLNILRNYLNVLPFGIMCTTTDAQDPFSIEAFSTGYAKLYLMTEDEAKAVETEFFT